MPRVVQTIPAVPWPGGVYGALFKAIDGSLKRSTLPQSLSQSMQPLSGSWAIKQVENSETKRKPLAPQNASNIESNRPKNIRAGDKRNVEVLSNAENFDSLDSGIGEQAKKFQYDKVPDVAKKSKGTTKNELSKYEKKNLPERPETQSGPSKKNLPKARSQNCSNFKEPSSIAKSQLTRREWLESHGADGLWAQCCYEKCGKWRLVLEYEDPTEVPENWYCHMNSDPYFASCEVAEDKIPQKILRELIENKYHVGSIVWARLDGYPWWPAMVDDCPDLLRWCQLQGNSRIPTKYHVVFFDTKRPQRAWIPDKDLKAYINNPRETVIKKIKFRGINFTKHIDGACAWANEALALAMSRRIEKFGWTVQVSRKGRNVVKNSGGRNLALESSEAGASKKIGEKSREIKYKVGDVVWTRAKGYPWWPAMIDNCPILRQHYKLPEAPRETIKYHVVYFGAEKLEVDWCVGRSLKRFSPNPRDKSFKRTKKEKNYRIEDFNEAWNLAATALKLPLLERLKRFDFNAREIAMRSQSELSSSQYSDDKSSTIDKNQQLTRDNSRSSKDDCGRLYNNRCWSQSSFSPPESIESSIDMSQISDPRSSSDDIDENRSNETKRRDSQTSFRRMDIIMKDFYSSHSDCNL